MERGSEVINWDAVIQRSLLPSHTLHSQWDTFSAFTFPQDQTPATHGPRGYPYPGQLSQGSLEPIPYWLHVGQGVLFLNSQDAWDICELFGVGKRVSKPGFLLKISVVWHLPTYCEVFSFGLAHTSGPCPLTSCIFLLSLALGFLLHLPMFPSRCFCASHPQRLLDPSLCQSQQPYNLISLHGPPTCEWGGCPGSQIQLRPVFAKPSVYSAGGPQKAFKFNSAAHIGKIKSPQDEAISLSHLVALSFWLHLVDRA